MDIWMDIWVDGLNHGHKWMNKEVDIKMAGQMDILMSKQMETWTNRQIWRKNKYNGYLNEWITIKKQQIDGW